MKEARPINVIHLRVWAIETAKRSADFQSAVSQFFKLLGQPIAGGLKLGRRFGKERHADYKSAVQQSATLRYFNFGSWRAAGISVAFSQMIRVLLLLALALPLWGATPTTDEQLEGQALAVDLCALTPDQSVELTGKVTVRKRGQPATETPFVFKILPGQPNWTSIYQTLAGDSNNPPQQLVINRAAGKPNRYLLVTTKPGEARLTVTNGAVTAAAVFAGSDFQAGDLGLEFLRWRDQRLLRKEMTMSRPCKVLESKPGPGDATLGYSRVIAWVDNETGGILKAEAFDAAGKRLKDFELNSFKKVDGQYQLEEMEIRNVQTRSRTRLTFDLGK